ncbi:MAG: TetR/AcrR family transcriptional regulator [Thermodesulfobacteriota bacterium]
MNTYHHGNLQNTLIQATLELIGKKGVEAFTIREVARRAGVSHAAPYRHFKDKDTLLAAVAKEGFDTMVRHMRDRIAECPEDRLRQFQNCGIAYIEFAIRHPAHYRVMFGPAKSRSRETEAVRESAAAAFQTLLDCIAACQAAGLVRSGELPDMALSAWSLVHGFAMLCIDRYVTETRPNSRNLEGMMRVVTESLYVGLRPVAPSMKSETPTPPREGE